MSITTIRVTKDIRDRLAKYAKQRRVSMGAAIDILLREEKMAEKLGTVEELLREQNMLLREILNVLKNGNMAVEPEPSPSGGDMPEFVVNNPWLEILTGRGRT